MTKRYEIYRILQNPNERWVGTVSDKTPKAALQSILPKESVVKRVYPRKFHVELDNDTYVVIGLDGQRCDYYYHVETT